MSISDKAARALYRANAPSLVNVSRRARGRSPVKGGGKVPDGRNVHCRACEALRRSRYERGETRVTPDGTVWFTNEGGTQAQAAAEIAAGNHVLTHKEATTLRVPLPAKYAREWATHQDDTAGVRIVEENTRQVILELSPEALHALTAAVWRVAEVLGRTYAGDADYGAARRCYDSLIDLGLTNTEREGRA